MKTIIGVLPVGVVVLALTACAAKPASEAIAAKRDPRVPYSYRMVRKGDQVLYCRKEGINGSRTQMVETCLSAEEIQAQEQKAATLQRDMDASWEKKPVMDNLAGRSNGVQAQ